MIIMANELVRTFPLFFEEFLPEEINFKLMKYRKGEFYCFGEFKLKGASITVLLFTPIKHPYYGQTSRLRLSFRLENVKDRNYNIWKTYFVDSKIKKPGETIPSEMEFSSYKSKGKGGFGGSIGFLFSGLSEGKFSQGCDSFIKKLLPRFRFQEIPLTQRKKFSNIVNRFKARIPSQRKSTIIIPRKRITAKTKKTKCKTRRLPRR